MKHKIVIRVRGPNIRIGVFCHIEIAQLLGYLPHQKVRPIPVFSILHQRYIHLKLIKSLPPLIISHVQLRKNY